MNANDVDGPQIAKPNPVIVVYAALLWILGCPLVGVGVAACIGEHGAIVFAILGLAVGVAGALAHVALLLTRHFNKRAPFVRCLIVWVSTLSILMIVALVIAFRADTQGDAVLKDWASFIAIYALVPSLFAASAFSWLVNRAAA